MVIMGVYALLASPVSWAHHWVWVVPGLLVLAVHAYRSTGWQRWVSAAVVALGPLVFYSRGIWQVEPEPSAASSWSGWEVIVGNSYVWWGLAFVVAAWVISANGTQKAPDDVVAEGPAA